MLRPAMLAHVNSNAGQSGRQRPLVWAVVGVTLASGVLAWVRWGPATFAMLLLGLVAVALARVVVTRRRA